MGLWGLDDNREPVRMGEVTRDDKGVITARATAPQYMNTVNLVMTRPMVVGADRSSGKIIRLKYGDRDWFHKLPQGYHGSYFWAEPER